MNGSLVCLSTDGFKTFYFGTIDGERKSEDLSRGRFHIKFDMETVMPEATPFARYVMIESPVYFEVKSRQHVPSIQNYPHMSYTKYHLIDF